MVFSGDLPQSSAEGVGSIPGQGTKIPHGAWHSQKKKEREKSLMDCVSVKKCCIWQGLTALPGSISMRQCDCLPGKSWSRRGQSFWHLDQILIFRL